jgi:hypothetical protein
MEKPFIIVARRAGMAYQNISRIVLARITFGITQNLVPLFFVRLLLPDRVVYVCRTY